MCDMDWYREFLELNPGERVRRDLTVEHAESKGGLVREYFRRLIPRYWYEPEVLPPGMAGTSLGLSTDEEIALLEEWTRFLLPRLEDSPEYPNGTPMEVPDEPPSS